MSRAADQAYAAWCARQGPRVHDRAWRLRHLPWRHRVLLRRYAVRGLRVLDFGCGDGILAIALEQRGARAEGVDISSAAIAQARRFAAGPRPVFHLDALPPGPFDVIICAQVLEHLPDDRAVVRDLMGRLSPGGMLIGSVPLGRYFWDDDHRREYDPASLAATLAGPGRVTIRRYYRSPLRNWLPWAQRGAAVLLFEVRLPR